MVWTLDYAKRPVNKLLAIVRRGRFVFVLCIAVAAFLLSCAFMFSKIEDLPKEDWEVDINSGRTRQTQYSLGIIAHRFTHDTAISLLLNRLNLDRGTPDWHMASRVTLRHGHVDYMYGAAPGEMSDIDQLWKFAEFSDDAKKEIALIILKDWHINGNCVAVDEYIQEIADLALGDAGKSGKMITSKQLPSKISATSTSP